MRSPKLPNAITLARAALVPVIVLTMIGVGDGGSAILPAALVVVAAVSDALDGHLARRHDNITDFGRIVDPIADKALITGALAVLVVQGRAAVWAAAAIVVRELAVTAMRWWAGRRGFVVASSRLGKNKATLQIVTIVALILAPDPRAVWAQVILYATVAITVVSGAQYFVGLRRSLAGAQGKAAGEGQAHRTG